MEQQKPQHGEKQEGAKPRNYKFGEPLEHYTIRWPGSKIPALDEKLKKERKKLEVKK
jgi:hypothetical protein